MLRLWFRASGTIEDQLHQVDVDEAAEFVPYLPHHPDGSKPLRLMKMETRRISVRDACYDGMQPLRRTGLANRGQKRPSDTLVSPRSVDVDRILGGAKIGSPLGPLAERGPTHNLPVGLRHEHRVVTLVATEPVNLLDEGAGFRVERRRGRPHRFIVDRSYRPRVFNAGDSNCDRGESKTGFLLRGRAPPERSRTDLATTARPTCPSARPGQLFRTTRFGIILVAPDSRSTRSIAQRCRTSLVVLRTRESYFKPHTEELDTRSAKHADLFLGGFGLWTGWSAVHVFSLHGDSCRFRLTSAAPKEKPFWDGRELNRLPAPQLYRRGRSPFVSSELATMPWQRTSYGFTIRLPAARSRAFRWATDYQPDDLHLMGFSARRKVRKLAKETILLTDTFVSNPLGRRPRVRAVKVKLVHRYPRRWMWTGTHMSGPTRHSQFLYELTPVGVNACRLRFTGVQVEHVTHQVTAESMSRRARELTLEDSATWRRLARALNTETR